MGRVLACCWPKGEEGWDNPLELWRLPSACLFSWKWGPGTGSLRRPSRASWSWTLLYSGEWFPRKEADQSWSSSWLWYPEQGVVCRGGGSAGEPGNPWSTCGKRPEAGLCSSCSPKPTGISTNGQWGPGDQRRGQEGIRKRATPTGPSCRLLSGTGS